MQWADRPIAQSPAGCKTFRGLVSPKALLAVSAALTIMVASFLPGGSATAAPASSAVKRCKLVTKIVHGKKKRVRVCRKVKPSGNTPTKPPPPPPAPPPPPPPPPPPQGTPQNPVPVETAFQIDEGWRLTLLWADPNQTQAILDAQRGDPDNLPEPPPPGYQFLLARASVTRTNPEAATFSPYSLDLAAASVTVYDDAGPACGTLVDPLEADQLADGQTATGNVCWKIATTDLGRMLMFYTDPFSGGLTYFSLGL